MFELMRCELISMCVCVWLRQNLEGDGFGQNWFFKRWFEEKLDLGVHPRCLLWLTACERVGFRAEILIKGIGFEHFGAVCFLTERVRSVFKISGICSINTCALITSQFTSSSTAWTINNPEELILNLTHLQQKHLTRCDEILDWTTIGMISCPCIEPFRSVTHSAYCLPYTYTR